MSAHDVQTKILEPMQRLFLPPRNMDEAQQSAALRDYVATLEQFDGSDLSEAWAKVRQTHGNRSWPLPSAFFKAASEIRHERGEAKAGTRGAKEAQERQERWQRWVAVSRSPMAQEAVRRGVAWSLKSAILYDGKKPEEIDLREFTSRKESAARTARAIENGEQIEFKGKLLEPFTGGNRELALSMYRGTQMSETRTQAEINYGVPESQAAE